MSRISLATEMCRADQLQENNGNTINMNNVHYCELLWIQKIHRMGLGGKKYETIFNGHVDVTCEWDFTILNYDTDQPWTSTRHEVAHVRFPSV